MVARRVRRRRRVVARLLSRGESAVARRRLREPAVSVRPEGLAGVGDVYRARRAGLFASAEAYDAEPVTSDCLILDVRLPGASGLELRDRLRARGSQVPVVFITGESGPTTRDGARNISHSDEPSLAKPFSDDELMQAIARAMAQAVR